MIIREREGKQKDDPRTTSLAASWDLGAISVQITTLPTGSVFIECPTESSFSLGIQQQHLHVSLIFDSVSILSWLSLPVQLPTVFLSFCHLFCSNVLSPKCHSKT